MLEHTKKIQEMYKDIQKRIYYMIPEKWDAVYLYTSISDLIDGKKTGELFFYYIPKGLFKKKPVNVYEIPSKFNLDEREYLKLVRILYKKFIILREEFKKIDNAPTWTNLTIEIKGTQFKLEYNYENLKKSGFSDYERHIIWRYKYLGIGEEQLNKSDREIIKKYLEKDYSSIRTENYEEGIYITDIKNIVDYDTENYSKEQNIEYVSTENEKVRNQMLMTMEEMKELEKNRKTFK